ncbi:dethiobiotin synthase [Spirochaetia bacterium 38H-sp]|uniref:ATP-dependent dethiobiotin synthetase BioD n=1 Tax=Rarispira pelagica TaxID=3141764 RepID=A0ABU9UC08_9SPIR
MLKRTICVIGIDTGIGKTIVTGLLTKSIMTRGIACISAKLIQTGSASSIADDILIHRKIMGIELFDEDREGITCPYIFPLPASPHLAAEDARTVIDKAHVIKNLIKLEDKFSLVIAEAAGGLMVPWTREYTTCDFLAENRLPVVLVSSSRLGSINHTRLTMEVLKNRNISVLGIIYNEYPYTDKKIADESFSLFSELWPYIPVVRLGFIHDFSFSDNKEYRSILYPIVDKILKP